MNSGRKRTIVFGLDGGTFDVVEPIVERGLMPTLARLMERGGWGELESTVPPMTGPAWASFMTGKNPGKHGVYGFHVRTQGRYDWPIATSRSIMAPTLWDIAGSGGRRSIVIDVPMTFPPWPINGLMVATFLAPSRESIITSPPELHAEIVARVGHYPFEDEIVPLYARGVLSQLESLERMLGAVKLKTEVAAHLLSRYDWDLAIIVFRMTDIVQHTAWRFWKEEYRRQHPEESAKFGGIIPQTYRAADRAMERILECAGGDVSVVVMSDHGAGPFGHFFHVNRWLVEQGLLRLRRGPFARYQIRRARRTTAEILRASPLRPIAPLLPPALRRVHPPLVRGGNGGLARVDWRRSVCYSPLKTGCGGGIILNVKGREPQGIVEPGAEYERLRDTIIARLRRFTDGSSGKPIMEFVRRREEVYTGPCLEGSPDIVFVTKDLDYVPRGDLGPGPTLTRPRPEHGATHRLNGMVILSGEGTRRNQRLEGAAIVDIAPTVLYLMGLPIPSDLDGRVLEEAFDEKYVRDHPVSSVEPDGTVATPADADVAHAERDAGKVDDILRGLGYIG